MYPDCTRPFCASTPQPGGYTCLSTLKCAQIQRNQSPILKAMYGDNFGEHYNVPHWKERLPEGYPDEFLQTMMEAGESIGGDE